MMMMVLLPMPAMAFCHVLQNDPQQRRRHVLLFKAACMDETIVMKDGHPVLCSALIQHYSLLRHSNSNYINNSKRQRHHHLLTTSSSDNEGISQGSLTSLFPHTVATTSSSSTDDKLVATDPSMLYKLMSPDASVKPEQMSTSSLAYLGDVVYELFIRSRYIWPSRRMSDLQDKVVSIVRGKFAYSCSNDVVLS
jgi:hypothetical protein